jgi:hypothetical protein
MTDTLLENYISRVVDSPHIGSPVGVTQACTNIGVAFRNAYDEAKFE